MNTIRQWSGGDPELRDHVERAMQPGGAKRILSDGPYRRLVVLEEPGGPRLLVKEFQPPRGARRIAALFGHEAAHHEWDLLQKIHTAGCAVPQPRAFAQLRDGRKWVVMDFVPGHSLVNALQRPDTRIPEIMEKLGRALASLHAAGFSHGDLHVGNWLWSPDQEPVLLDFQRSSATPSTQALFKDTGEFDFSLRLEGVSIANRLRFRMAALGAARPFDTEEENALRAAGQYSQAHALKYFRSRTRHFQRAGRHAKHVRWNGFHGLRIENFSEAAVRGSLAAHEKTLALGGTGILKNDHRAQVTRVREETVSVVVKEVTKVNWQRLLADTLRGSPAQRAWRGGHGLSARGIASARPFAYLEKKRLGIPIRSLLILEDLAPATPIHTLEPAQLPEDTELSALLRRLLTSLHRTQVCHGDLQAPHVFLRESPEGAKQLEAVLIDLEGVRFPRRLSAEQRIQALVELNASISDEQVPAGERARQFELYKQVLPFSKDQPGNETKILDEVIRRSLARNHFWKGTGCRSTAARATSDSR